MPDAEEVGGLRVARRGSAEESVGRAVIVTGDDFGKLRVLNAKGSASVLGLGPMQAAVGGDSDLGVAVGIDVADVNGVVAPSGDGRVRSGTISQTVGHGAHDPVQTIVSGDGDAGAVYILGVKAVLVGYVGSAVRRDPDVTVQAATGAGSDGAVTLTVAPPVPTPTPTPGTGK